MPHSSLEDQGEKSRWRRLFRGNCAPRLRMGLATTTVRRIHALHRRASPSRLTTRLQFRYAHWAWTKLNRAEDHAEDCCICANPQRQSHNRVAPGGVINRSFLVGINIYLDVIIHLVLWNYFQLILKVKLTEGGLAKRNNFFCDDRLANLDLFIDRV